MSARSAAIKKRVKADANSIDAGAGIISLASAELDWVFRLTNSNGGFSDEEFERFCEENQDLRIEMTKEGEMIILMAMTPMGGNKEFELSGQFAAWVKADGTGMGFSPSSIFTWAIAGGMPSIASTCGLSMRSRNCRA